MNNPVFLNKATLNLTWPTSQELMLHKGEVLQGQVRGLTTDGLVLLYLKGQLIEAAAEILVEPGQTLHLSVEDVKQGQAHLRVLTPAGLEKTEQQAFATRLMDLGIPARSDTIQIARTLSDYQLPVTRTNVATVQQGCAQLGEVNPQNINQVTFQVSKGIPLMKPILEALSHYIGSSASIDQLVVNVSSAALESLETTPVMSPAYAASATEAPDMQAVNRNPIPDLGQTANKNPGSPGQIQQEAIPSSVGVGEAQPVPSDQQVAAQTRVTGIPPQTPASTNMPTIPASVAKDLFVRILNWLPGLLEALELNPDQETAVIAEKIRHISSTPQDIIRNLTLIKDILQTETMARNHPASLLLAGKVEDLVRELTGQHLMQANPQRIDVNTPAVYLAFPVQVDQDIQLCQLRIHGDVSSEALRQRQQVNLVVSLDTAKMGTVLFHVAWNTKGNLDLQGVVESDRVKYYLAPFLLELNRALEEQGYQVNNLGLKVVPPQEADPVLKVLPQPQAKHRGGLLTVDIIV